MLGTFVQLKRGLMAPRTANIHFSDQERKVDSGFSLYSDSFLNSLLLNIFLTAILLSLCTNRRSQAITKQANQDRLQDYRFSIKFLENGL